MLVVAEVRQRETPPWSRPAGNSACWSLQRWNPCWVRIEPREQLSQRSCASIVDLRCFCFSMFSLFSCLLACLLDLLLSRVADEAFYKQPFADVIGYVYVAKLIPFPLLFI